MKRIGLVAGGGTLPREFIRTAKQKQEKVIVFAVKGMASEGMVSEAHKVYWVEVGQYTKLFFLIIKERVRRIAFIGKIDKSVIYETNKYDKAGLKLMGDLADKKDYSILTEVTRRLKKFGIQVISGEEYLSHLFSSRGTLSRSSADKRIEEDIKFGYDIAKKLADLDIGQTVVVKDKAVVAVESMEGTDETILRSGKLAGSGCVMVKVSRPDQDLRWDVPTVGPGTIFRLIENRFSALALEDKKTFIAEKEKFLKMADENNIVIQVI